MHIDLDMYMSRLDAVVRTRAKRTLEAAPRSWTRRRFVIRGMPKLLRVKHGTTQADADGQPAIHLSDILIYLLSCLANLVYRLLRHGLLLAFFLLIFAAAAV